MLEKVNSKLVIFPHSEQSLFINKIISNSKQSCNQLAILVGVSGRTVRDWRREKFKMPFLAVQKLSKLAQISLPKNIKLQERYAHVREAGRFGGRAVVEKYGVVGGDQKKRKVAWRKWWDAGGNKIIRNLPMMQARPIQEPEFSATLAELVGILLGDGGIAKYQVVVTLNFVTDKEYVVYVVELFKKLFGVIASTNKVRGSLAVNIVISRSNLVKFCVEKLGLKVGNKVRQQVDIPDWIKRNKKFQIACVRGLVDTDGSIFTHRYRSNGKYYSYKKFDYTSVSQPLLRSAYDILKSNGLHPRQYRGKSLRIDSIADMKKYFEIFGTSNPKHLRRYKK